MVARPSAVPEWATDANFTNGPAGIPGTPTKVSPSAGVQAEGYIPQNKAAAQIMNWWKNLAGSWVDYFAAIIDANEEHTYQAAKTRTLWIPPCEGLGTTLSAGTPFTEPDWGSDAGQFHLVSRRDAGSVQYNVTGFIPSGCTLTRVDALVDPGAARGAGVRLTMLLDRLDFAAHPATTVPVPTSLGTDEQDAVGHARQYLTVSGLTEVVDRSNKAILLSFLSGIDGAHVSDILYGIRLTFTDIGPRNG
jgi:hypothetical protein